MNQEVKAIEKSANQALNLIYTVDSFNNGIVIGQHHMDAGLDPRDYCSLGVGDEGRIVKLRSRYALHKKNALWELERSLLRLSAQGLLGRAAIYFGTSTDPFYPFDGKFDASMKFLQLFERYTPGLLNVQSRSPLMVIAMPILRRLGRHAAVTVPIETPLEETAQRYTPGLPRVEERLKTANALRNLGIEVTMQVSPLLPYGDWKKDAAAFAELLVKHGDYVYITPLSREVAEKRLKNSRVAKSLAFDRKFHWLRPDAAEPLIEAVKCIDAAKLKMPKRHYSLPRQMDIFAA